MINVNLQLEIIQNNKIVGSNKNVILHKIIYFSAKNTKNFCKRVNYPLKHVIVSQNLEYFVHV